MKKSTVLIVLITFVVSVVIVGVFGMKMMSYDTKIYVEEIRPTKVILSTEEEIGFFNVEEDGKEIANDYYTPRITFVKDMVIHVDYELKPADATNKNVSITVLDEVGEDVIEFDGMNIVVHQYIRSVRLVFRCTDGNGKQFLFRLNFKKAG